MLCLAFRESGSFVKIKRKRELNVKHSLTHSREKKAKEIKEASSHLSCP